VLWRIHRYVLMGRPVTVGGETGPPRWSRWALRHAGSTTMSEARDRPFSLSSPSRPALLELVRDPQHESYRFEAEVHHQIGAPGSKVGIYFAHHQQPTGAGYDVHSFFALMFNDLEPRIKRDKPDADPGNLVELKLCLLGLKEGDPIDNPLTVYESGVFQSFSPVGRTGRHGPTRRLAVVVKPQSVQVWWEGKPLEQQWQRHELKRQAQVLRRLWSPTPADLPFSPQGALGLFVENGEAIFQSVQLTPLNEGP
jgi:hypothetical protein